MSHPEIKWRRSTVLILKNAVLSNDHNNNPPGRVRVEAGAKGMASPTYWRLFNPAPCSISGAPSRLCIQSLPATAVIAVLADGQQVALINI
jgi:hypothetical protein